MRENQVSKIDTILPLKVHAQACTNHCEEKIWAGKTSKEGNKGGCWSTTGQTARGAWW